MARKEKTLPPQPVCVKSASAAANSRAAHVKGYASAEAGYGAGEASGKTASAVSKTAFVQPAPRSPGYSRDTALERRSTGKDGSG